MIAYIVQAQDTRSIDVLHILHTYEKIQQSHTHYSNRIQRFKKVYSPKGRPLKTSFLFLYD